MSSSASHTLNLSSNRKYITKNTISPFFPFPFFCVMIFQKGVFTYEQRRKNTKHKRTKQRRSFYHAFFTNTDSNYQLDYVMACLQYLSGTEPTSRRIPWRTYICRFIRGIRLLIQYSEYQPNNKKQKHSKN